MNLLKYLFSISLISLFLSEAVAQEKILELGFGLYHHSRDFVHTSESNAEFYNSYAKKRDLIKELSLKYSFINEQGLLLGLSLSYLTTEIEFSENSLDNPIHPYYGFVVSDLETIKRNYVFVTPAIGFSKRVEIFNVSGFRLNLPLGLRLGLPVNCYDELLLRGRESVTKIERYRGENFSKGLLYGLSVSPSLAFYPWEKKWMKQLSLNLGLEANLLFQHEAELNPKYLLGFNAGVGYNF